MCRDRGCCLEYEHAKNVGATFATSLHSPPVLYTEISFRERIGMQTWGVVKGVPKIYFLPTNVYQVPGKSVNNYKFLYMCE